MIVRIVMALCGSAVAFSASAGQVAYDTNFGSNSIANIPVGDNETAYMHDSALQADGKIVAVGESNPGTGWIVARFNADGTPDTGFGSNGLVRTRFIDGGSRSDAAKNVAILGDGKILVGAYTNNFNGNTDEGVVLARYNSDGSLDTSFDSDGLRLVVDGTTATSQEKASDMLVQPDGKILFHDFRSVYRFNADGSADTSFSDDGRVFPVSDFSGGGRLGLQSDGKILVTAWGQGASNQPLITRFNSDGTRDTSFGSNGTTQLTGVKPQSGDGEVFALRVLADDSALMIGYAGGSSANQQNMWVAHILADGAIDTNFGANSAPAGSVFIAFASRAGNTWEQAFDAIPISGNRYLVVGFMGGGVIAGAVLNADGSLDTTVTSTVAADPAGTFRVTQPGGNPLASEVNLRATSVLQTTGGDFILQGYSAAAPGAGQGGTRVRAVKLLGSSLLPPDPVDETPDPFGFTDLDNAARDSFVFSEQVTITGISDGIDISKMVTPGLQTGYSINAAGCDDMNAYSDPATIDNGDRVCVAMITGNDFDTTYTISLTIGDTTESFNVTTVTENGTPDTTPDAFGFTSQDNVGQSTVVVSNTETITGLSADAPLSITGGEYAIGCNGNFASGDTTIANNQTVCVRHTSADQPLTDTVTTLTIGGVQGTFTSTTAAAAVPDTTPNVFSFVDQDEVALSSTITSNAVTINGIDSPAPVSVSNGSYSVGCGDAASFTTDNGSIENGQTVCVRHTSAATVSQRVDTTLDIGGVSDVFSSITAAQSDTESVNDPDGNSVAVGTSAGQIENLNNADAPPAGTTPPAGVDFPNGVFSFDITGLSNGQSVEVTLTLPAGAMPTTYYKFQGGGSFEFLFDGTEGAQISGNVVTLTLVDGGVGDADGTANGTIVDPGAPGLTSTPPPTGGTGGNGGSLASVSDSGGTGAGLLSAFGLAALWRRRRHPAR